MNDRVRFKNPPVKEVACGLTFATPLAFRVAHVGLFWERVRKLFPRLEEAAPLVGPGELSADGIVELSFAGMPIPRTWMICEDGSALIQLQRDRLIYNWKAASEENKYPSYDAVIVEFEKHLSTFNDFLSDEGMEQVEPVAYELTYVNHIPAKLLASDQELLIDHVRSDSRPRFLPKPSRFFWTTVYPLPEEAGELQVTAQEARTQSDERLIRLDMVAQGFPSGAIAGQRDWFDLAHVWITKGFADITGEKTQKEVWERTS